MSFIIKEVRAVPKELSLREISRYMGMRPENLSEELLERIRKLLPRFLDELQCRACWLELPVNCVGSKVDLHLLSVISEHLARNLDGCTKVVLFAATIGSAADRLCKSASAVSPSSAVIIDAMGSTAIEWFCDEFCKKLEESFPAFELRPRFSPGYGDLPLQLQEDLIRILDANRKIGLVLSDSFMMLPQKSVTAIVGLRPYKTPNDKGMVK